MAINDHFGGGVVLSQPCFHSSVYTPCLPRHAQANDPPHWESIKYNQKFYEGEFLSGFDVIESEEKDRVSVINALKTKKVMNSRQSTPWANNTPDMAISQPSAVHTSKPEEKWDNGMPN